MRIPAIVGLLLGVFLAVAASARTFTRLKGVSIQAEIASTDRSINERAREIEEVSAAYEKDIERFEMLLEVVEMRQSLLATQQAEKDRATRDPRR